MFRDIMKDILNWDAKGLLSPMPVTTYGFENVVKAHKAIESRKTVGKFVLKL